MVQGKLPGFRPLGVVDVGANAGSWTRQMANLYPQASFYLLDADQQHDEKLSLLQKQRQSKQRIEYEYAVLTDQDGDTVRFFAGGDTGNSMYKERSDTYRGDEPVSMQTRTLDSMVQQSFLGKEHIPIDILKVDVQGAELEVLRGGLQTLVQATFVQVEASFVQLNEGGACYWQVEELLRQHGFALYDVGEKLDYYPLFRTTGTGQMDQLFINTHKLATLPKLQNTTFCTTRFKEKKKKNRQQQDTTNDNQAATTPAAAETTTTKTALPNLRLTNSKQESVDPVKVFSMMEELLPKSQANTEAADCPDATTRQHYYYGVMAGTVLGYLLAMFQSRVCNSGKRSHYQR